MSKLNLLPGKTHAMGPVYKNTMLKCKDPLFRNSCQHAGKVGTCALVRKMPNGTLSVVPPESVDPNKDVCFVSPPYVSIKGTAIAKSKGSMK